MIYNDIMKNGIDSTLMKDPVSVYAAEVGGMGTDLSALASGPLSALGGAGTAMSAAMTTLQASMLVEMQSVKTRLPLVAAQANLADQTKLLEGQLPGVGASANADVDSAFSALIKIPNMIKDLKAEVTKSMTDAASILAGQAGSTPMEKLKNFSDSAPPATIDDPADPGKPITNPLYTAWETTHSTVLLGLANVTSGVSSLVSVITTRINNVFAEQKAAVDACLKSLKDLAFASFASSPHSASIQAVLDKVITVPAALRVEKDMMGVGNSSTLVQQTPTDSPKSPSTVLNNSPTPKHPMPVQAATPDQLANLKASLSAKKTEMDAKLAAANAQAEVCEAWKLSHDVDAYQKASMDHPLDPVAKKNYILIKIQFEEEALGLYRELEEDYTSLKVAYNKALSDFYQNMRKNAA